MHSSVQVMGMIKYNRYVDGHKNDYDTNQKVWFYI